MLGACAGKHAPAIWQHWETHEGAYREASKCAHWRACGPAIWPGADTTQRHLGRALGKAGNEAVEVLRGSLHGVVRVMEAAQLHLRLQEAVLLPGRADGGHVLPGWPASDRGARVVVPKSHKRSHEFCEGARHGDVVLRQRRVQDDLGGQNSDVLDLKVGAQCGPRRVRAGVLGPQRSCGVRKLNFYHQVQLRRQHLPAAQDAHHGGAQQRVRVAALVHRVGNARVVHFVEPLHGLVAVVLSALQQVMHGHGAAVVVDVVAALAVGEDLDALDEAGGVGRGWGQRVGAVRVPDAEGDLDGLGVDEGRAAGQRDAADPRGCGGEGAQRAGEVLRVVFSL